MSDPIDLKFKLHDRVYLINYFIKHTIGTCPYVVISYIYPNGDTQPFAVYDIKNNQIDWQSTISSKIILPDDLKRFCEKSLKLLAFV